MALIANDPSIVIRSVLSVLTVAVAVGTIAGSIAVGIVVGKLQTPFTASEVIVVRSPATIVLNRFILSNEVPLFYNVVETMNISAMDIKTALTTKFGPKFIAVQFQSFSATPNVTSNDARDSFRREKSLKDSRATSDVTTWKPATGRSLLGSDTTMAKVARVKSSDCTDFSIVVTPCRLSDTCVRVCDATTKYKLPCSNKDTDRIDCVRNVTASNNCFCNTSSWSVECSNLTITLTDCFDEVYKTFCQSLKQPIPCPTPMTPTTSMSTSPTMITTNLTKTSTTVYSVTSPATVPPTTPPCENSTNGTVRSSIIISQMFLFFKVKESESIPIEDILDALSNIKPSVALLTTCGQANVENSSFNRTLSRIEQPTQVNLNPDTLINEPSISTTLASNVTAAAIAAAQNFTTTTVVANFTTITPSTSLPVITPAPLG